MATAVCVTGAVGNLPPSSDMHQCCAPINFFYGHLHNSIRAELDKLSSWVLCLEPDKEQDLLDRLLHLKERYYFLEQVYKYHSSVEDEVTLCCFQLLCTACWHILVTSNLPPQVVYPALDSKVRNVTSAYSVEHQDEVGSRWNR